MSALLTQHISAAVPSAAQLKSAQSAIKAMQQDIARGAIPALAHFPDTQKLEDIEALAQHILARCNHVIIVGTGGSSLTGQTLVYALQPLGSCRVSFWSNIDPQTVSEAIASLGEDTVGFILMSKSGETLETLVLSDICLRLAKARYGKRYAQYLWCITDNAGSTLRSMAEAEQLPILPHAPVGGRFSIFTEVGLLPAAIAGIDIHALCDGARSWQEPQAHSKLLEEAVAFHEAARTSERLTSVLMTYTDRLGAFGEWFEQIWAESLGKDGKGFLPVSMQGTIDQHSQLQYLLDGPSGHAVTLMDVAQSNHSDMRLEKDSFLHSMAGLPLNAILAAEREAVCMALTEKRVLARTLLLPQLDAKHMGALVMHMLLETCVTAKLLNINPFDQPAVEAIKRHTFAILKSRKAAS